MDRDVPGPPGLGSDQGEWLQTVSQVETGSFGGKRQAGQGTQRSGFRTTSVASIFKQGEWGRLGRKATKYHRPGLVTYLLATFDIASLSCQKVEFMTPHLLKWPSDLKINGRQENVTFSGPVFHGLSCGVFLFVASNSFKNHPLNGWNFSTANQVLLFYGF